MKTATFIKKMDKGFNGDARLYELSSPLEGHKFVIVSAVVLSFPAPRRGAGKETYIFPADETGKVTSWGELRRSYKSGLSHTMALRGAGYKVIKSDYAKALDELNEQYPGANVEELEEK